MSALMTWNRGVNTYAKAANTSLGAIDALIAMGTAANGEANCRWQMVSSNNATNPYYVTFKRKNAAPGRIVFANTTATAITIDKAAIVGDLTWPGDTFKGFYFPNATTDTPSGWTGGGTVFDNDAGVNPTYDVQNYANQANTYRMYDCEDGIVLSNSYAINGGFAGGAQQFLIGCGMLVEDELGKESNAFIHMNLSLGPDFATSSNSQVHAVLSGISTFATLAFRYASLGYLNDSVNSKTFFLPAVLASAALPYAQWNSHKLRQMGFSRSSTVGYEQISITGPSVAAHQPYPNSNGQLPWLLNFII